MQNSKCFSRVCSLRQLWVLALHQCVAIPSFAVGQIQTHSNFNEFRSTTILERPTDQFPVHSSLSNKITKLHYPEHTSTDLRAQISPKPSVPTVKLTGFVHMDAGWFTQNQANRLVAGDIQDGADFRRARLAAKGVLQENLNYFAEFDFASPGRPNFMDVWLQYNTSSDSQWRIGQFRHPFGMDGQTSIKELTFLERGLPFAFLPFRQIGLMYSQQANDQKGTFAISVFRFPTDSFGGNVGDNGGYGLALRFTRLLVESDNQLFHIGGGFSFGDPANDQVRYRNQPEFFVAETGGAGLIPSGVPTNVPAFVDTGAIATNSFQLFNSELGFAYNSFHFQAEGFVAQVNQIGRPSVTLPGGYIQTGYVLTGETRQYNHKVGVFGNIAPHSNFSKDGYGAIEVATRLSYIELNDKNIQGGNLLNLTVGANWYWNAYTKFQFNYVHANLQCSSATSGPVVRDSFARIFAFRAQFRF